MWKNNTSSVTVRASAVLLAMALGTSSATCTSDIFRSENSAVYQVTEGWHEWGWKSKSNSIVTDVPDRLIENLKKIFHISCLTDNWNGNGAGAFTRELLDKIRMIISNLDNQPEIFPTAANSIQFEYDGENDSYLEIEITESENADVYRINRDGSEDFFKVEAEAESLNQLVKSFYG